MLLIYGGVFWYIFNDYSSISSLETKLSSQKGKLEALQSDRKLSETVRSSKEKLDAYFVPAEGEVAFIERIEKLGKDAQVELEVQGISKNNFQATSFAKVDRKTSEKWEVISLVVKIKGSWQNILVFMSLAESLPLRIDITRASLQAATGADEKKGSSRWEGVLTIDVLKSK